VTAGDASAMCFLAVVFTSAERAEDAAGALRAGEDDLGLHDVAVVTRTPRGAIELHQTRGVAAGEALVGVGTAGLVAGLLMGVPIAGALVGLLGGGAWGIRDRGLPDDRMRELGADLQPGQAVLCVLVDADGMPRARAALSGYGAVAEVALASGSEP
jgi:uncharacterized membrane protein